MTSDTTADRPGAPGQGDAFSGGTSFTGAAAEGRRGTFAPEAAKPAGLFAPFEWMLAWRYLKAKRRESVISVISGISFLGIMLGVATLIIVMAVMNGFRTELIGSILGVNGHMTVSAFGEPLENYETLTEELRALGFVETAVPLVEGEVMASANDQVAGSLIRGLTLEDLRGPEEFGNRLLTGNLADFEGRRVMVASGVARRLGLRVGDTVTLIAPRGAVTAFGTTPRVVPYRVAGIFSFGMSEYDNLFIYMPRDQAQKFFSLGEGVSGIKVDVDRPDQVPVYRAELAQRLPVGTRVLDWQQMNQTFVGALQVERNVMFLILMLIIVVAALNIISGLIMLVKDKGRDIAVLRTMGASRGAIMRVFLIAGASIGVVGTLAGFALGVAIAENVESIRQFATNLTGTELFPSDIYFLSRLPSEINNGEVASVVIAALVLSLLAPLYPAWRAARMDPVEALRYE